MAEKRGTAQSELDDYRSMRVLEEIERNPHVSQRELASSVGVAVGIANSLVHALVRKGLVKIRGENNRSITYHITKKGFGQKATLAMQWTANTIDFYRQARSTVSDALARVAADSGPRIVMLGANEATEIAVVVAAEAGVQIVGIVRHPGSYAADAMLGVPVGDLEIAGRVSPDAAVLCLDPAKPEFDEMYASFHSAYPDVPIYAQSGEPMKGPRKSA